MEYLPLILGLAGASAFAGLLAGFLGVGGGIVLVPAMFWMFEIIEFPNAIAMHMAVATSLATIVFTAISSARAHHARGGVDMGLLLRWALPMGLGALAGGLLARFVDANMLKLVFGSVGIFVSLNFCLPKPLVIADHLPRAKTANGAMAGVIGMISALMGIGGGTLGVPTLSAFSYPVQKAVGTAAAFGLVIAVPAVLGFVISGWGVPERPAYSLGYVSLPAALAIIPITTSLAPLGARLAYRLDAKWIKYGFALFLGVTSLRMLAGVLG
ncbi:MAG: sulfite exporter TauE/SafE family protein [Mangrovicoccus sp.]|nr:sulfite exporter TauE/SafE family protein [Mangrovicoccus sp.]